MTEPLPCPADGAVAGPEDPAQPPGHHTALGLRRSHAAASCHAQWHNWPGLPVSLPSSAPTTSRPCRSRHWWRRPAGAAVLLILPHEASHLATACACFSTISSHCSFCLDTLCLSS